MNFYANNPLSFGAVFANERRLFAVAPFAVLITIALFMAMKSMVTVDVVALAQKQDLSRVTINPKVEELEKIDRSTLPDREVEVTAPPPSPKVEVVSSSLPDQAIVGHSWVNTKLGDSALSNTKINFKINRTIQPIFKSPPAYPQSALQRNLEGYCSAKFDVGINGSPLNIKVNCTSSIFERSAKNAISRWKYSPRIVDGQVVIMYDVTNSIKFQIAD